MSNIHQNIKTAMNKALDSEFGKNPRGAEGMIALSNMKSSLPEQKKKKKKKENKEATGSGSAGGYTGPLFSTIKKETKENETLKGGLADNKKIEDIAKKHKVSVQKITKQLQKGLKVEKEHTKDHKKAMEIAMDHLMEDPIYYQKLEKIETKEATGSASSGSYETPAAWAKSTSKKDWRGKSKTQIPGGKFVQVKKKCKKFPYCNQGDINALKLFDNKLVESAIKNLSKKYKINENLIKKILSEQFEKRINDKLNK